MIFFKNSMNNSFYNKKPIKVRQLNFAFTAVLLGLSGSLYGCAGTPGLNSQSSSLDRATYQAAEAAISAGDPAQAATIYANQYERSPSAQVATREGRALRLSDEIKKAVLFLQTANQKYPNNALLLTELARSSLAGGYIPEARDAIVKASTLPGADWTTWLVYGAYAARTGNYEGAKSYFQKAASLAPTTQQSYSALADANLVRAEQGDLVGAVADLRSLSQRPGADPKIAADAEFLQSLQDGGSPNNVPIAGPVRNRFVRQVR